MKSHKSRLLRMFVLNLIMLLLGLATFITIDFNQSQSIAFENQSIWLQSYSKSFLNDLKVGNTISIQNKLQILTEGKYFLSAKLDINGSSFEAVRAEEAIKEKSLLHPLFRKTKTRLIDVPVKDQFNSTWGTLSVVLDPSFLLEPLVEKTSFFLFFVLGYSSVLMGFLLLGLNRETEELTKLITYVKHLVARRPVDLKESSTEPQFSVAEWAILAEEFKAAIHQVTQLQIRMRDQEIQSEIGRLSGQVAHDIRSPLAALNLVVSTINGLPEEERLIIRNATQRITDIANQLLQRSKKTDLAKNTKKDLKDFEQPLSEDVMLVALLDSIISEKRVQFRELMEIEIQGELDKGYGLFTRINPSEFSRVISNLVNNSVEAISELGRVTVGIQDHGNQIIVSVSDNGKGIAPMILRQVGNRGVSFGKSGTKSGFGLGIHYAREIVELAGGQLSIKSQV